MSSVQAEWLLGAHAVGAAIEAGRPLDLMWVQRGRHDRRVREVAEAARREGIPVRTVERAELDRLARGGAHGGVAARTAPHAFVDVEKLVRPEDEPGRLILLDSVSDPRNVGAVIRSVAAFGVEGVILAGPGAPPLGGALASAAAGQLERVPIARAGSAGDTLRRFQDAGYWTFGAAMEGTPLPLLKVPRRWVLALGSEGRGLRAKTRAFVDELVAVPMQPGVESLNISVAAAILAYSLTQSGEADSNGGAV